jgi:hypothetical protein
LRNIFLILALSGILIQNLSRVFIYIDFQINRDFIARNLCENRDKPIAVCGGKCYLQKQFEAQTKTEQSNPLQIIKSDRDIQLFLEQNVIFTFINHVPQSGNFAPFLIHQLVSLSFPVFHPPAE